VKRNFTITKIIGITLLVFVLFDLFLGKYIYKKFIRNNFMDVDTSFGIRDDIYDHKFKPNYNVMVGWGKSRYRLCTDSNGFRNSCDNQFSDLKEFDIGFVGDSFTEPVGINFEKSFVGIISSNLKNKKIANLAVTSYSPSIYYAKINYLLSKGYKFKEIIVFIDLSDLVDDTLCYKLDNEIIVRRKSFKDCYSQDFLFKNKIKIFLKNKFMLSHEIYELITAKLINNNLMSYTVPYNVTNHLRSDWTHNYKNKNYNNFSYEESTRILLTNMEKLAELSKDNKIDLSVAVYPWPGTLKYDLENNKQLKIWKSFCDLNCKKFYNFMKPFYNLLEKDKFINVYRRVYIENDVHFNEEGNKIIAENFLELYKE